jgi:hypothetical protein
LVEQTSSTIPQVQAVDQQHNATQPTNASQQQRKNDSRGDVGVPQVVPSQPSTHETPKVSTKAPNASLGVVDQMKKTNVNISMWDVVSTIPSQKRLLQ